ncbi:MAG: class C sortase, partial [bacterium]
WHMTKKDLKRYDQLLNVDQNGLMGYITIPKIGVNLPIYHGTGEAVLQRAIGHIEGSSLPVGGQGSHCIVSGHRGLPSAKLFTHLDELELADQFILHVLDETYYYEVDDIQVIEPTDLEALEIDPEKDYCTLVTCTPYGINTHRLLVRGHRIEDAGLTIQEDAVMVEKRILAPLVVLPFLIILCMNLLMERLMRKKKTKEDLL